jgi:hypothetical protein
MAGGFEREAIMQSQPRPVQPLDYHAPPPGAGVRRRVLVIVLLAGFAAVCLLALSWLMVTPRMASTPVNSRFGGNGSSPGYSGSTAPAVTNAVAPGLIAASDAQGQAAAAAMTDMMARILSGKGDDDPDLAPVARKLKPYTTWAVTSAQRETGDPPAWTFGGWVEGPQGTSTFSVRMVKQKNGAWAVGYLRGPNPK